MEAQCLVHVMDQHGTALPGVTLVSTVGEVQKGLNSDAAGDISVPVDWFSSEEVLLAELRFLGMESQTVDLMPKAEVKVVMRPDVLQMDEVVVTGEYSATDARKTIHRIEVITAEELQSLSTSDLSDILQHTGEVQIRRNGVIGTGIDIQGLGDRNVKITINEVPVVGRVDGKLDLDQLDVQSIERIEIVKGPMAVSYGTDAIAGVINIITKEPVKDQQSIDLRTYASSEGQYDLLGSYAGNQGAYDYRLRAGRRYFDGWSSGDAAFKNPEPIADARRNALWNPKEQYLGGLEHGYRWKRTRISHRLDLMQEELKDKGLPAVNDAVQTIQAFDDIYTTRRIDNSLRYSHDRPEGRSFKGFIAFNHFSRVRERVLTDVTDLSTRLMEEDTTLYSAFTTRHTWQGVVTKRIAGQVGIDGSYETSTGERIAGEPSLTQVAAFASAEVKLNEHFLLRPGLRAGYHELFDMPIIPSVALRYSRKQHQVRASIGRGFRAPDFKELYLAFFDSNHNVFGNEDLEAERSLNFNLSHGFSTSKEGRTWDIETALFYNQVEDLIALVQIGEGQDGSIAPFSYLNLDEVQTQGGRIDFGLKESKWKVKLGWGITGREDRSEGEVLTPMYYYQQVNTSLGYFFEGPGIGVDVLYSYNGEQNTLIQNSDEETISYTQESYSMLDMALSRSFLDKRLDLKLGVRNLFDVASINAGASSGVHGGGGTQVPITTGRNYFISLDYRLNWNEKTQ